MSEAEQRERRAPVRQIDYEDVDDVIGVASELAELEASRLSVEELVAIARDLDVPEQFVGPAVEELRRRRQAELAIERRRSQRRRWALGVAATLLVVLAVWALTGQAALSKAFAEVAQKRAQVRNVVERQRATEQLWNDRPSSDERFAELAGAENRVRLERRRYDEAAAAYNADAGAFPASLWASIFGYPGHVPLSNEVTGW